MSIMSRNNPGYLYFYGDTDKKCFEVNTKDRRLLLVFQNYGFGLHPLITHMSSKWSEVVHVQYENSDWKQMSAVLLSTSACPKKRSIITLEGVSVFKSSHLHDTRRLPGSSAIRVNARWTHTRK
jgi:hypothetical protein